MTVDPKHLDIEQIERLLQLGVQHDSYASVPEGTEDAWRHLIACEFCQRLLSMEREKDEILRRLRVDCPSTRFSDCPTCLQLYELAAGLMPETEATRLLSHVVTCEHCSPSLRLATQELRSERSTEEEVQIGSLETSGPGWQKAFAARMVQAAKRKSIEADSPTPAVSVLRLSGWRWFSLGAAAAAIVALLVVGISWRSSPNRVRRLLAEAYTEHRTMELRIPGARFSALPEVNRGDDAESPFHKPIPLLEAEEIIARRLRQNPSEVDWMQTKIQADLLERKFTPAIETAIEALRQHPQSASVLRDLGTAYDLRADNEDSDSSARDRAAAYEVLSRSFSLNPDDPVVLFNRAIVAEKLTLFSQAIEDWEHFLRIETDSQWLEDGRGRLKALRQKLEKKTSLNRMSAVTVEEVASALANRESIPYVQATIDAYQKLLWERWLPELVSSRAVDSRRRDSFLHALQVLSENLRAEHNDAWLVDFLSTGSLSHPSGSVASLMSAVQANSRGEHTRAAELALSAEKEFQIQGQQPGRMRAALEEVYSYHLAAQGRACHEKAMRLLEDLNGRNFSWLEIQTWLEAGACAAEISRVDESIDDVSKAVELAGSARYPALELRGSVFEADLTTDTAKRLNMLLQGLRKYWSGTTEPMRGYSLYAVMDTTADDLKLWFFDEAVIKQGLELIADDPDLAMRGMEQYRLAKTQVALGKSKEAEFNFTEARNLLERSGSNDLTTSVTVDLAESYLLLGQYEKALEHLGQVEANLSDLSHDIVAARFHSARAVALLATGRTGDAEDSLNMSRKLAFKGIGTISSERERFEWIQSFLPTYTSLAHLKFASDAQTSFQVWESFRGASLSQHQPDEDVFPNGQLPQFSAWQSDGTILVSYVTFSDGVAAWVFDGTVIRSEFIRISASEIEMLLGQFSANCRRPSQEVSSVYSQGRQLFDLLIKPIASNIDGKRKLIIETDETFGEVPFEAFVDSQGHYLAQSYEIEYAPGLLYLALRRNDEISRNSRALIVGVSQADPDSNLPPLPDALSEARAMAQRFEGARLLLDDQAIPKNVRALLTSAEIFHFAGHAVKNRRRNVLILNRPPDADESRFLDVNDFSGDALKRARLVVLSACSTASGIASTINDRDSLVRNALASGVPNVIASRWQVDSAAARSWMDLFYAGVLSGESASSAARKASIELSASPRWRHPYYWASFTVFV